MRPTPLVMACTGLLTAALPTVSQPAAHATNIMVRCSGEASCDSPFATFGKGMTARVEAQATGTGSGTWMLLTEGETRLNGGMFVAEKEPTRQIATHTFRETTTVKLRLLAGKGGKVTYGTLSSP